MSLPSDADLRAAVEAETDAAVDLLECLVRVPSLLGDEEPAQALLEAAYRDLGAEVRSIPIGGEVRAHATASPFSWSVDGKRNVVGTIAAAPDGPRGRSLCFNGHVDVVPPGPPAAWTSEPFEPRRDGDWLYGRGAGDMKCGLVAVVQAMRAIRRLGVRPAADVILQSVVEEECTGNGALACVLAGSVADGVVVAEPFDRAILTAQVGVLWFTVRLAGRAAHVAEATDDASAIEQAIAVIAALRRHEAERNESPPPPYDTLSHPINLNVGTFRAGDWASSIAAEGELGCRIALYPGESVASARAGVEAAIAAATREHPGLAASPPTVHYDGFACEGFVLEGDEPILLAVSAAAERVTGTPPTTVLGTGTTDARAFVQAGIPAVCYGPRSENLHAADERVWLPSVTESALVYATLVRDWCGLRAEGPEAIKTIRSEP